MPKKVEGGNENYKDSRKGIGGRTGKYETHIKPYLMAIKAMMRNGATMAILAQKFEVAEGTLYEYKKRHPEFNDALKENAEIADFTIESHLYEMAKTDKVAAFFWLKNRQSKRWRDKQHVFQTGSTVVRKDYDNLTEEELEAEMEQLENIVPEVDYESEGEVH